MDLDWHLNLIGSSLGLNHVLSKFVQNYLSNLANKQTKGWTQTKHSKNKLNNSQTITVQYQISPPPPVPVTSGVFVCTAHTSLHKGKEQGRKDCSWPSTLNLPSVSEELFCVTVSPLSQHLPVDPSQALSHASLHHRVQYYQAVIYYSPSIPPKNLTHRNVTH